MQSSPEEVEARQKAAAQRVADHIAWKREFFQSRPPPPSIGRLHRRQSGRKGGGDVHITLKRARELEASAVPRPTPLATAGPSEEVATSTADSRQSAWVHQMQLENAHRSPFTDRSINTDSRRTVIIAGLHPDTVEEDLRVFADQFGRVLQVRIVRHYVTGKSRRYGFVEYGLPAEASKAVAHSRGKRLRGRAVCIDMEKGRTVPGFLPARMATAAKVGGGMSRSTTGVSGVAAAPAAPLSSSVAPATNAADDDDEAFLNSLMAE